jgi:uncharacterized iron-regulated membrane protein
MSFRKVLFWAHLSCGVLVGLVVLMMSVTGVLLTYERQMLSWANRQSLPEIHVLSQRAPLQEILDSARKYAPAPEPSALVVHADPAEAIAVQLGRERTLLVDPYTSEVLGEGATGMRNFFGFMTQVHRWFAAGEESRATARAITGASNLIFLFIVISGMYLWLPMIWRKTQFRMRLVFARNNKSSKARDFNWHHVFGIWMCIPLVFIIATATVFSYTWSNNLVFRAFGEEPPVRSGPPGAPGSGPQQAAGHAAEAGSVADFDVLLAVAGMQLEDWRTITLRLPVSPAGEVVFTLDQGNGGQPHKQATLTLDAKTAAVVKLEGFEQLSPARQTRSIIRRLHTGEVLGLAGQTLAGVASFAAIMLVWTGLALAWRRLIQPLYQGRRA